MMAQNLHMQDASVLHWQVTRLSSQLSWAVRRAGRRP